jgi:hypothetical protein
MKPKVPIRSVAWTYPGGNKHTRDVTIAKNVVKFVATNLDPIDRIATDSSGSSFTSTIEQVAAGAFSYSQLRVVVDLRRLYALSVSLSNAHNHRLTIDDFDGNDRIKI